MDKDTIVLGSGKLYVLEFSDSIPENATIETEANRIGYIQGGASIEYKPTFYEAKDDLGLVSKKILTDEEAVLKSGIMTWNLDQLAKMCNTGAVTEDAETNIRTLKIGGVGNYDGKQYVIHFLHEDPEDGDLRVTIIGTNEAGFTVAFAKDKETVINAEFKAQPADNNGTLIILQEEMTENDPVPDTTLSALTLGLLKLTPAFDPEIRNYTAATTDATNPITAIVNDDDATVAITLDAVAHTNGDAATWDAGENAVVVTVTNGAATRAYNITVTKSAG